MSIRLIVEILDHAPADLSLAERLVLVVIAEEANDATRRGWPPLDVIADRAGLDVRGAESALRRLRQRGYDIRVPLKVGKDGRPVYAWRGRSVTYAMPSFPRRDGPGAQRRAARVALSGEKGPLSDGPSSEKGPLASGKGPLASVERPADGVGPSPHTPHIPSSSSGPASLNGAGSAPGSSDEEDDGLEAFRRTTNEIARRLDCDRDTAADIAAEISDRHDPRNLLGYVNKLSDDDLHRFRTDVGGRRGQLYETWPPAPPPEFVYCPSCALPWSRSADIPDDRICSRCRTQTQEIP